MDLKRGTKKEKSPTGLGCGGRIAIAVVAAFTALFLFFLIFAPVLSARRHFSRALRVAESFEEGTVLLHDPYVEGGLLPDAREVLLTADEASSIAKLLTDSLSSCRYVKTERRAGGLLDVSVRIAEGEDRAIFYLSEDAVTVEKNSTFYRFSPRNDAGKAAYAELYETVTGYLSSDD